MTRPILLRLLLALATLPCAWAGPLRVASLPNAAGGGQVRLTWKATVLDQLGNPEVMGHYEIRRYYRVVDHWLPDQDGVPQVYYLSVFMGVSQVPHPVGATADTTVEWISPAEDPPAGAVFFYDVQAMDAVGNVSELLSDTLALIPRPCEGC